jgi:hypothetical protein
MVKKTKELVKDITENNIINLSKYLDEKKIEYNIERKDNEIIITIRILKIKRTFFIVYKLKGSEYHYICNVIYKGDTIEVYKDYINIFDIRGKKDNILYNNFRTIFRKMYNCSLNIIRTRNETIIVSNKYQLKFEIHNYGKIYILENKGKKTEVLYVILEYLVDTNMYKISLNYELTNSNGVDSGLEIFSIVNKYDLCPQLDKIVKHSLEYGSKYMSLAGKTKYGESCKLLPETVTFLNNEVPTSSNKNIKCNIQYNAVCPRCQNPNLFTNGSYIYCQDCGWGETFSQTCPLDEKGCVYAPRCRLALEQTNI